MELKIRHLIFFVIILINIGCDQASKSAVRKYVEPESVILVLDNHIILTRIENTGAFLSLGSELREPFKFILLTLMPLSFMIILLFYAFMKFNHQRLKLLGFAFILGGGFGNMWDRIVYGSVTDFLFVDLNIFHTGVFNVADMSIMFGTFIVFSDYFLNKESRTKTYE